MKTSWRGVHSVLRRCSNWGCVSPPLLRRTPTKRWRTSVVFRGMELTDDERDLILAGLLELVITYVEDDEKRDRCKA